MKRRPKNFQEWRGLYQKTMRDIGFSFTFRQTALARPIITKVTWKLIHRARRISLQLDAEFEAKTTGAMLAVLELLEKHNDSEKAY